MIVVAASQTIQIERRLHEEAECLSQLLSAPVESEESRLRIFASGRDAFELNAESSWACAAFTFGYLQRLAFSNRTLQENMMKLQIGDDSIHDGSVREAVKADQDNRWNLMVLYLHPLRVHTLTDECAYFFRHTIRCMNAGVHGDGNGQYARRVAWTREGILESNPGFSFEPSDGSEEPGERHVPSYRNLPMEAMVPVVGGQCTTAHHRREAVIGLLYAIRGDSAAGATILQHLCDSCSRDQRVNKKGLENSSTGTTAALLRDGQWSSLGSSTYCVFLDLVQRRAALLDTYEKVLGGPSDCELSVPNDAAWPAALPVANLAPPQPAGPSDAAQQLNRDPSDSNVAVEVGIFVMRSLQQRPYVEETSSLALTIRIAHYETPGLLNSVRVHVMLHEGYDLNRLRRDYYDTWDDNGAATVSDSSSNNNNHSRRSSNINGTLKEAFHESRDATASSEAVVARAWLEALGPGAAHLLGGVHMERPGALPRYTSDLNYLRKTWAVVVLCRRLRYSTVVSVDDDVLVAPAAFRALVLATPRVLSVDAQETLDETRASPASNPDAVRGTQCAMVTPTISSGIPTAELFAERFLKPEEQEDLNDCYAYAVRRFLLTNTTDSQTRRRPHDENTASVERIRDVARFLVQNRKTISGIRLGGFSFPAEVAGADEEVASSFPAWNATVWYRSVRALALQKGWLERGNLTSEGAGIHPVRFSKKCASLSLEFALRHINEHFGIISRQEQKGGYSEGPLIEALPDAPYLCNSIWATTPSRLAMALSYGSDSMPWAHPFEEAAMSRMFLLNKEHKSAYDGQGDDSGKLCVLKDTFVIHPSYGAIDKLTAEIRAHEAASSALRRRIDSYAID